MLVKKGFEYKGYKIGDKVEVVTVVTSKKIGTIVGFLLGERGIRDCVLLSIDNRNIERVIKTRYLYALSDNTFIDENYEKFEFVSWFDFEEIRVLEEGNKETEKVDKIKPNYYKLKINGTDCEVDDVMQAIGLDMESVYISNVLKYVSRYKGKNGLEDLKKAQEYLGRLIKKMVEK